MRAIQNIAKSTPTNVRFRRTHGVTPQNREKDSRISIVCFMCGYTPLCFKTQQNPQQLTSTMKKHETVFSLDNMAVLVVCHKVDYEASFTTAVACAKRFPLQQVFVLDYGEQTSPNNFMQEWLEDIDLHGVQYIYWRTTDKFVAVLKTCASVLQQFSHILLVDTIVKAFPPDLKFDFTFSADEDAPCMKLARRKKRSKDSFVWQALHAQAFVSSSASSSSSPHKHADNRQEKTSLKSKLWNNKSLWHRSIYIWERSALLACYYYSHVVVSQENQNNNWKESAIMEKPDAVRCEDTSVLEHFRGCETALFRR